MAWSNLLILGYLMYLSTGCNGVIVVKPEHRIGKEGQSTKFTCKSNATGEPLEWLYSAAGQKDTVSVCYNTTVKPPFVEKMIVNQSEIDDMLYSTLEIKNSTLRDAGIFSCVDEAPHGRTADAIFSVTQDIKCRAACTEDVLWVQCNTCYKSDELLELVLNNTALIPATYPSKRMNDTEKGCVQIESNWILKFPCYSIPESHISVMLWGDKTHTNISSHSIRILTDESSGTTTTAKTQSATNPAENDCKDQNSKTSLLIGLGVLLALAVFMGIAIIGLGVYICRLQNLRQPPQQPKATGEETPLDDLTGSNNNSPRSRPRVARRALC